MTDEIAPKKSRRKEPAQDGQQHFRNLWEYPLCNVEDFEAFVGVSLADLQQICGGFEIKTHTTGGKQFVRPVIIAHHLRALA